jgi:biopolymer transport protein ExbD
MHHKTKGQANKKATREMPEEDPEFQIAPMIDILLVLLVFFMSISSTQVMQVNDKVKLPVAKEGKKSPDTKEGRVIVNVLWSAINNVGTIEIDGKNFGAPGDVQPVLFAEIQKNPEALVLIRSDKAVRYDYLRGILKAAGGAGVTNVTFSVINKEAEATK